jgi:hypothetical protein
MKKGTIFGGGIVVFALISIAFFYYSRLKSNYIASFQQMQEDIVLSLKIEKHLINYFEDYWEFPPTFDSIVTQYDSLYHNYIHDELIDPLSKSSDPIYYIPLYNRKNHIREACLLLSVGIDGKIDNVIKASDTIYIDEFSNKINLYNTYIDSSNVYNYDSTIVFNLFDYFFGNKDYLYKYLNGIYDFKQAAIGPYSLSKLEELLLQQNYQEVFLYSGEVLNVSNTGNEKIIYFKTDNYLIKNIIYKGEDMKTSIGGEVSLIGIFDTIDQKGKTIVFRNCIHPGSSDSQIWAKSKAVTMEKGKE